MSFFTDRLEAFPRLADYRLAKAAGYWPYYKTVESAARARFTAPRMVSSSPIG